MKWKFSLWANLELKFFRKLLLKNWKCHSWSFSWWFFVENWYNLVQGHKKDIPFYKYEGPPFATPTTQRHRIMEFMRFYENAWLGFRYCTTISYKIIFQHPLESPKSLFSYFRLTIKLSPLFWRGLYLPEKPLP